MWTQQQFVTRWRRLVAEAVAAQVQEQGGNNLGAQVETYQRARGGEPGIRGSRRSSRLCAGRSGRRSPPTTTFR